ncbi:MAG: Fe-S cluster assembly protein SufD [Micropepsaceae bacterium]
MAQAQTSASTISLESEIAALFAKSRASLPGPTWLQTARAEALSRVMRDGLPHRRIEAWKYTDFRNKLASGLDLAQGKATGARSLFDGLKAHRIDINGGMVARAPTAEDLPDGLEILSLAEASAMPSLWLRQLLKPNDTTLDNLNLAFARDGALIRVGQATRVADPIFLCHRLSESGAAAHTRSVIALEEGAELTLIEIDDGTPASQSFANTVTAISLEPGARLRHIRVTASGAQSLVVRNDTIEIARDATYEGVILSSAAAMARQQLQARMTGPGGSFDLACAYAAGEAQHTDYTIEVVHEAPNTRSRILSKGIASGTGHAVVQGRVIVRSEAQKTDSHQLSRALLLSPHAEIDQKPELEIFADDVKCGHGAAIGALDLNQLFYLRARGIPEREARNMLVAAFLGEVTERIPSGDWRERIEAWLGERMAHITGDAA